MIERFTVDRLADDIETRVKGAHPEAKMTRRFFRKGKRDGRRQLAFESIAAYLSEAVGIATNKIGQDHVDAADQLARNLAGLRARRVEAGRGLERASAAQSALATDQAAPASGDGGETAPPGSSIDVGVEQLGDALGRLRAKRARVAAEAAASAAAAEVNGLQSELDSTIGQISVTEQELVRQPDSYRQQVATCHRLGAFLWARYCSGYELGKARRGNPDDEEQGPVASDIEFEIPPSFERQIIDRVEGADLTPGHDEGRGGSTEDSDEDIASAERADAAAEHFAATETI